jgi:hypothetical protein
VNQYAVTIFYVFFGVILGIAFISLISLIPYVTLCKWQWMRVVLHIFWNILIFSVLITWLLGISFTIAGIVSKDSTAVFKYILGEENLKTDHHLISGSGADLINTCLNGIKIIFKIFR